MTVVVRAEPKGASMCCVCGQRLGAETAQAFVFLPGSEDPEIAFAHGECIVGALNLDRPQRRHGAA